MIFVLIGVGVLAALVYVGRGGSLKAREWRLATGVMAVGALLLGGFLCLRGAWLPGLTLTIVGGVMALSARIGPSMLAPRQAQPAPSDPGEAEARSILGVGPEATRAEIEAAYQRVIKRTHPDQGGTSGLAAQVNAARARLLGKR